MKFGELIEDTIEERSLTLIVKKIFMRTRIWVGLSRLP